SRCKRPCTSGCRQASPTTCGQRTASPSCRGTPPGSRSRPSIGKESTSVGSSIPRCSRFSDWISLGPTKTRPSSPSVTPSASSRLRASAVALSSSTSTPLRFETSTAITFLSAPLGTGLLCVQPVRLDDSLDELVADDVLVPEPDEGDPIERAEDVLYLNQPRRLIAREVDLGDVGGADHCRAETNGAR